MKEVNINHIDMDLDGDGIPEKYIFKDKALNALFLTLEKAMTDNADVVSALEQAIGSKANQNEFDSHVGNDTIHITSSERNKWNSAISGTDDTKDNIVSFTSNDTTNPTSWSDVSALTSGEKHTSIFTKISTMFKNIRYLYKLIGTTDISAIGNGTITGGLSTLNSNFSDLFEIGDVASQKITWVSHTSGAYYCDLSPITLKKNRKISFVSQIVSGNMGVFQVQTAITNTTLTIRLWATSNGTNEITNGVFKYISF